MARKLTVSIWYLLKDRWTTLEDIDESLKIKIGKVLTAVGQSGLEALAKSRKALREEVLESLLSKRPGAKEYVLQPDKKFVPARTHRLGDCAPA